MGRTAEARQILEEILREGSDPDLAEEAEKTLQELEGVRG
jgi:hypothetical protein